MRMRTVLILLLGMSVFTISGSAEGAGPSRRAKIPTRSAIPYIGAIVVDPATGRVLWEDKADAPGYPASLVKLMDLLLVIEGLEAGHLRLTEPVRVTAASSRIGGSQVYLAENEVFSLEELVYATAIHSANDAATALAIHVAGTKDAFVELMNRRAAELGMAGTRFGSVHGLPPAAGQKPDVSSARDLAVLACEILKHPQVLRYTSIKARPFRNGSFDLRNPNRLIGTYEGCDGLKTGYIAAGGFSIVATAERNGRRVVAVVLGCKERKTRDEEGAGLLSKGFLALASLPPPVLPVDVAPVAETNIAACAESACTSQGRCVLASVLTACAAGAVVILACVRLRRLLAARSDCPGEHDLQAMLVMPETDARLPCFSSRPSDVVEDAMMDAAKSRRGENLSVPGANVFVVYPAGSVQSITLWPLRTESGGEVWRWDSANKSFVTRTADNQEKYVTIRTCAGGSPSEPSETVLPLLQAEVRQIDGSYWIWGRARAEFAEQFGKP